MRSYSHTHSLACLGCRSPLHKSVEQIRCTGRDHLYQELARIEKLGGEGLMLRKPKSLYVEGRSATLLKVKTFRDAEARIIGYTDGKGRHKDRIGALIVRMANGKTFKVGTGYGGASESAPSTPRSLTHSFILAVCMAACRMSSATSRLPLAPSSRIGSKS